jgi:hypothetical protein
LNLRRHIRASEGNRLACLAAIDGNDSEHFRETVVEGGDHHFAVVARCLHHLEQISAAS